MSIQPLAFFQNSCNSAKMQSALRNGATNFNCVKNPSGGCECQIATNCSSSKCYPVSVDGCMDCTNNCKTCEPTKPSLFTDVGNRPLKNSESSTPTEYWVWWRITILVMFVLLVIALFYHYIKGPKNVSMADDFINNKIDRKRYIETI